MLSRLFQSPEDRTGVRRATLTGLVIALLAGTTGAFALTEALKLERRPLTVVRLDRVFSPTCGCPRSIARLAFKLRDADTVDAVIVDGEGKPVRALLVGAARAAGVMRLVWDGTDDQGTLAPDGSYRLQIRMHEGDRTIEFGRTIRIDTAPPEVAVAAVRPRLLSLSGAQGNQAITVTYWLTESSLPILLVDGTAAVRGTLSARGRQALEWGGEFRGRRLRLGRHVLALRVRDRVGNVVTTRPLVIRVVR
ncbi:MAG: hypothetical protein H0V20_06220 [Actinobacteria bacterium]|nr:hypothetical protein [Actinomycetota bacterium]